MSLPLNDTFDDANGRLYLTDGGNTFWYDTSGDISGTADDFLTESGQQHVDVRTGFWASLVPRTQGELSFANQSELEDDNGAYNTQDGIEFKALFPPQMISNLGSPDVTVVRNANIGSASNWNGASCWVKSTSFEITFVGYRGSGSYGTGDPLDISDMESLSIPLPDKPRSYFTAGSSTVRLSSSQTGEFDDSTYVSATLDFGDNTSSDANELRLALADFESGAGVNFSLDNITGVEITFAKTSGATVGDYFSMLGVRALHADWTYTQTDVNTHYEALVVPPTINGAPPSGASAAIPLIRGEGEDSDPKPLDVSLAAVFNTGHNYGAHETFSGFDITDTDESNWLDSDAVSAVSGLSTEDDVLKAESTTDSYIINLIQGKTEAPVDLTSIQLMQGYSGYGAASIQVLVEARGASGSDKMIAGVGHAGVFYGTLQDDGTHSSLVMSADGTERSVNLASRVSIGGTYYLRSELSRWTQTVSLYTGDPLGGGTLIQTFTHDWSTTLSSGDLASIADYFGYLSPPQLYWRPRSTSSEIHWFRYEHTPTDTTGNTLSLIFREVTSGASSAWMRAYINWNFLGYTIGFEVDDDTSDATVEFSYENARTTPLKWASPIDYGAGRYMLRASLKNTDIRIELIRLDANDANIETVAQDSVSNTLIAPRIGRVGFWPQFTSYRDAYVSSFIGAPISYGRMMSKVFPRHTPIDGGQLIAECSPDANLFRSMDWINREDKYNDLTKSATGSGSFRTKYGIFTNQFLVDDWRSISLRCHIWVSAECTEDNQPILAVISENGEVELPLPALSPNAWNFIDMSLTGLSGEETGIVYALVIRPQNNFKRIGFFNIDHDFQINRRMVDWQVRAIENGTFRSFGDQVNTPNGAVHLPIAERGKDVQIQATLLSPDANIESYQFHPRNAPLGNLMSDQAYETGQ